MKRFSIKQAGYDKGPTGGIFGGAWHFAVKDGPVAVALEVLTSTDYPDTVSEEVRAASTCWPAGRDAIVGRVSYHRSTPTEHLTAGQACTFLPGGLCYGVANSYTQADEFLSLLSVTFEQTEAFWKKLEGMAAEYRREVET